MTDKLGLATPRSQLLAELMDSNVPKTEREHAAVYEIERLRARLGPLADPVCLICGRSQPCMTDEEAIAKGGPGAPCTFDLTPQQLWDENVRLRVSLTTLAERIRERCAKECDGISDEHGILHHRTPWKCADAIRALSIEELLRLTTRA